jgi:hypothetical protein
MKLPSILTIAITAPASLNISTSVALVTHGYTNIHERRALLDVRTTNLVFEGEEASKPQ